MHNQRIFYSNHNFNTDVPESDRKFGFLLTEIDKLKEISKNEQQLSSQEIKKSFDLVSNGLLFFQQQLSNYYMERLWSGEQWSDSEQLWSDSESSHKTYYNSESIRYCGDHITVGLPRTLSTLSKLMKYLIKQRERSERESFKRLYEEHDSKRLDLIQTKSTNPKTSLNWLFLLTEILPTLVVVTTYINPIVIVTLYNTHPNFRILLETPYLRSFIEAREGYPIHRFKNIVDVFEWGIPAWTFLVNNQFLLKIRENSDLLSYFQSYRGGFPSDYTQIKWWLLEDPNYSDAFITIVDGKIEITAMSDKVRKFLYGDLFRFQIHLKKSKESKIKKHGYIITIYYDLTFTVVDSDDRDIYDPVISPYIEDITHYYLPIVCYSYFNRFQRWFKEKPWLQLEGKTVPAAIQILERLGW